MADALRACGLSVKVSCKDTLTVTTMRGSIREEDYFRLLEEISETIRRYERNAIENRTSVLVGRWGGRSDSPVAGSEDHFRTGPSTPEE